MDALHHLPLIVCDTLDDSPLDSDPAGGQALLATMCGWALLQRAAVLDALDSIAISMNRAAPLDDAIRATFIAVCAIQAYRFPPPAAAVRRWTGRCSWLVS